MLDAATLSVPLHGLYYCGMRMSLSTERPLPARGYHGSWLRGMLGHALFRNECLYSEPRCVQCAVRTRCPYPQAFKPEQLPGRPRLPAYVIHEWDVPTGERRFRVSLILIGAATRFAETWIRALHQQAPGLDMGGAGMGRLEQVRDLASGRLIFERGRFLAGAELTPLRPELPGGERARVRFLTPLVTKHATDDDPLLRPLRTRLQRLVNDYGNGSALGLSAAPWRVVAARARHTVIPRGTDRPRRVGGDLLDLELTDIGPDGAELLGLGRYLHAGGETSLGFGRYTLMPL